jgi:DHA1 family bicyclomycin/chloramphenicol resistance-like MFS transporter
MTKSSGPGPASGPGFAETVALIAALMGMGALSIDTMLPGLPAIGATFSLADANDTQLVVYVYMLGFALTQVFYGPLADSFGRRKVQLIGLSIMLAGAVLSTFAASFGQLLMARVLQGVGAASTRVLTGSMVRDRYAGREMARVMSFTAMVFFLVPAMAPAVGGLMLAFAGWRAIFAAMAVLCFATATWFFIRMPETLHPEFRRPFSVGSILGAVRLCVTNRQAVGYSTAIGLLFGALMGYIGSAEQILGSDVYRLGTLFPLAFASVTLSGALSGYVNSRFVRRFGMRKLGHGSHIAYVALTVVFTVVTLLNSGIPPLWFFLGAMIVLQFFFSNMMGNYNAMAIDPLGAVAGTGSSLIGAYTTLLGTASGAIIGQSFNGTVMPLVVGQLILAVVTLAIVRWTEHGRLFTARYETSSGH